MIFGITKPRTPSSTGWPLRQFAFVGTFALIAAAGYAGVTLTPYNGTVHLPSPGQPKFTITANLPNPQTATDANANSQTDTIAQIQISSSSGLNSAINASSYNSLWSDPRGNLGPRTETYTVDARGYHYEAYHNWVDGYWYEDGHWEEECHEEEEGYWDEYDNWNVTGYHTECNNNWIVDSSGWVDAHWDDGISAAWVSFGSANITFYITNLQGSTSLTPFNNSTNLASPAQPKFTITSSIVNGRTVTDGNGNTRTDGIAYFQIYNPTYGWFPSITVDGSSYNALWADPRSSLAASTQTYTVYTWAMHLDTYDNGWVPAHWDEQGHWEEECHEEEEGYWDEDDNWNITGYHTECNNDWIVDSSGWVDGYEDTGFIEQLEEVQRQEITFIISTGTAQTITFPAIGTHSWGEPAFALSATSTPSGLPVSYSATGPASISGNMVTLTGTGTVVVTASQAGNATYSAATPVSRSFNAVSGQAQTITFSSIGGHAFGDPSFVVFASASSGLPVAFSVTAGLATISGSTVTLYGAGSVTITATQAGNATFGPATPVAQTFTVSKAVQTISFQPIDNCVEGTAPFEIFASATSFLPIAYSISGPATLSSRFVTVNGPGTVTIIASQLGDEKYSAATAVTRTFNVGLGPNGHTLTVQYGTAGAPGGNYGYPISIAASVPSGQFFSGWTLVSGTGTIADVSLPITTFTMGSTGATVYANFVSNAPTNAITWNEVNLPSMVTAGDPNDPTTVIQFSAAVTNSGSAPWGPYMGVSVRDPNNQWVSYSWPNIFSPGGAVTGGKVQLWFCLWLPSTPGTYTYTFSAGPAVMSNTSFSTITRTITVLARSGARPVYPTNGGLYVQSGTVGLGLTLNLNATNSPTSYSVLGTLPPGVSFNASTGQFSGTPTQAGRYAVTASANNSAGIGVAAVINTIYPSANYNLTVVDGSGSTSNLTVGTPASIAASPFNLSGQIFNGWRIQSGPGAVAIPISTSTSLEIDQPGDVTVKANYITGNPLTVVEGTSSSLGGLSGSLIDITARPDGNGTMFSNWTCTGPGTIGNPTEQTTTFRMGATGATVTANFVPGYRLTVVGGTGYPAGGLAGSEILVNSQPPQGLYTFEGWWVNGPGYVLGNKMTMGNGAATVNAAWWPVTGGPLPRTYLTASLYHVSRYGTFTVNIDTTCSATVTGQQLGHSTDNGLTWTSDNLSAMSNPETGVWHSSYTTSFAVAGAVIFRAKAIAGGVQNPVCSYLKVTVLNQDSVAITTQPTSLTVAAGQPASFFVVAYETGALTYQWYKGGTPITGATSATYTINITQPSDAGNYAVNVANGTPTMASNVATLTVSGNPPAIIAQPAPVFLLPGQTATFSVVPGGTGPFTFQWQKNGVAISGATSASYTVTNVQNGNVGSYAVVVTNRIGSVTSSGANLTTSFITFTTIPNKTTASSAFALTASASSGLPVTFSFVGGPASVSGSTVTLSGVAGKVTIRASQAGNATYSAAIDVFQSFTVAAQAAGAPYANEALQVTASQFLANWSPVAGATGYRLDVSTDITFSANSFVVYYNNKAVLGVASTVTGLSQNTTYYYRVRAESSGGTSANSNVVTVGRRPVAQSVPPAGSIWKNMPVWTKTDNAWTSYDDGIPDEIIPSGLARGLTYYIYEWQYTDGGVSFEDYNFPVNDYWWPNNAEILGDPNSPYNNFNTYWHSDFYLSYPGETWLYLMAEFNPEPGYYYDLSFAKSDNPDFSVPTNVNGFSRRSYETDEHQWIPLYNPFTGAQLDDGALYLVRYGKPFTQTRLNIAGMTVNVGMNGSATAGPITIGGSTISLSGSSGSITLPGGTTITSNGTSVTVSGIGTVSPSTVINLPDGSTLGVDGAGNVTLTVASGTPLIGGAVINKSAAGGGNISFPNGTDISVAANGRLGVTLPPGTSPTIISAVEALKVLQQGAGAVISVRDILTGIITSFPNSGLINDIDDGITGKGRIEVGLNLGDSAGIFWFDVIMPSKIAVDANRDGAISFDGSDLTTSAVPYRFWLNDDIDWQQTVDGDDSEEDDLQTSPNGKLDWQNNYIPSKRDLEDFARIQISAAGLADSLKPKSDGSADLYIGLKWVSVTGTPAIKLYKHVETAGGLKYLTDETTANQQINTTYCVADIRDTATLPQNATMVLAEGSDVFILPPSVFSGLSANNPRAYLLFEGCKVGTGELRIVLLNANKQPISESAGVWMDLKKVGDMYEHWSVGNSGGGVPDPAGAARIPSLTGSGTTFKYDNGNPSPEDRKYILFVHGWNMLQWEKERYAETAYKRLYWQGYKGRFGLFSWPTTNGFSGTIKEAIVDSTNYDRGEWSAWRSATPLRQLLQTLNGAYSGELYVLAHSMGNVVVGEALRLQQQSYTGQVAKVYVASQAALPTHCYDGSRSADLQVDPKAVLAAEPYPQTPNIYPDWLSANGAAVGKRVNFFNVNDFALWVDAWQLNQVFKPDERDLFEQPWYYQYVQNENYPLGHWYKSQPPITNVDLTLGSAADIRDRYEIMAFAAESRSKALGATSDITTFAQRVDLQSLWPTDTGLKGASGLNYSAHKWHSAQFRSTNMRQGDYWKKLLGVSAFGLTAEP